MSSERDWRAMIKVIEKAQDQQDDSLELGDSWRGMPRRTEGVVNKTNGLYRRSTATQQPTKNLYNFIIAKQPSLGRKTTDPSSVNEVQPHTTVTQPQKSLLPSAVPITSENSENSDLLDFSEFISTQNNGFQAITSTPYPLRQIDENKSPTRSANVLHIPVNSPKKLFAPTPTRIPIITPRTSRIPSDSIKRAKLLSDTQKMPSACPVVSSTVHNVGDEDEPEPEKSLVEQPASQSNRILPAVEKADRLPIDKEQQEQDAGTRNSDEAVFRRPELVQRPLLKQNKLELDDEQPILSNSQRNKKSKPKVNALLESYMKVGESIINRTNSVPLENSSSSSRRRLYKKGDSCNEEDILKQMEPLDQPSFVLNPISAGDNRILTKVKSISVQSIAAEGAQSSENDPNVNAATRAPTTKKVEDQPELPVMGAQVPHSRPSEQHDGDKEKDRSKANGIDQQNSMSKEHSNKQVLEEILEDWSDTAKPPNDDKKVDNSDSSDSEKEVSLPINKQPETESKVRQARSKNQKNEIVVTASSKTNRKEAVCTDLQRIQEDVETDKDELSTMSMSLRNQTKNASDAKRAKIVAQQEVPTKSKPEPVHSTQHVVIENGHPDSDESGLLVQEPSNRNVKRTRAQRTNVEKKKIQPPNTSRSKKRNAKNETDYNEVDAPTKSKRKAKDKRLHVEDQTENNEMETEPANNAEDIHVSESDDESEAVLSTKPQTKQTRKKRQNIGDDVTEADGKKTEMPITSKDKGKKRSKAEVDVIENDGKEKDLATTSNGSEKEKRSIAEDDVSENNGTATLLATASTGKKKNKHSNAEGDVMENGENTAALPGKSQTKTRKKRLNIEENATEVSNGNEPEIEVNDLPAQGETDDNGNNVRSTTKSNARQSKKRKYQSIADAKALPNDDSSVGTDASVAKKRKKVVKWEKKLEINKYDSLKPRAVVSGVRHSARERRLPNNNLLIPHLQSTSNRSALQRQNGSIQPKIRRTQSAQSKSENNVYSMLLNGSIDKELPLITRFGGIEITQGFHKTVKNDLVIHHIPGETGPCYGYFTLEPGTVKRACRISWNLHIHVVSGPVQITTDNKSEQMVTGSFASLPIGTKYSLQNDGENPALVFFSQHGADK